MTPTRLRLTEFCTIIDQPRAAVRAIMARGEAPFHSEPTEGSQRTYDGADLLSWCLFTSLRNSGMQAAASAERVLLSGGVGQFFRAMDQDEDVTDWHLLAWHEQRQRADGSRYGIWHQTHGESSDVAGILRDAASDYGKANKFGELCLGITTMTAVPFMPCFHRCQSAVEAADLGLVMRGADLIEADT